MKLTLKRFIIGSSILFLCGAVAFAIGLLLGGDPLDGLAGGTRENTDLEDILLGWGYVVAVIGIVPALSGITRLT